MKKPCSLNLKEKTEKRNRGVKSNFESRKADYNKLKTLRKALKEKKEEKLDQVKN